MSLISRTMARPGLIFGQIPDRFAYKREAILSLKRKHSLDKCLKSLEHAINIMC